jgi:hypothetical protein
MTERVNGQCPTRHAPAPLPPDFLADLVRLPVAPSVREVLVAATVQALLEELETGT